MHDNYHNIINLINKLNDIGQNTASLEMTQNVINALKINPQYPIILVGGTNGKGSTCGYLTNILMESNYKVGTFTSPHIFKYNERICIDNIPISDDNFIKYTRYVATNSNNSLGIFKTITLACHLYFMEQDIDIAVIEVGIGGRCDVTNLFEPTISAVTNVELDHCEILGDDRYKIGFEKAHIYRPHKWAFYGDNSPPQSILEYANKIDSKIQILNQDFGYIEHENCFDVWCENVKYYSLPYPLLRGIKQPQNAALSIAILSKLRSTFPITLSAIKNALLKTKPVGRFDVMPGLPQIIFDVAHNLNAVEVMTQNMVKLPYAKNNIAVFGIMKDKQYRQILQHAVKYFNIWHIAQLDSSRTTCTNELQELLVEYGIEKHNIYTYDKIALGMKYALEDLSSQDRVVCFGSFLAVSDAYAILENLKKRV